MEKKEKKKSTSKIILNWMVISVVVIFDVILALLSFAVVSYGNLSKNLFLYAYIAMAVFVIIVNTLGVVANLKKQKWIKVLCLIIVVLLTSGICYGYSLVLHIGNVTDQIINTGDTTTESLQVSFVTYNNNLILTESDIEGHKFGIVGNESFQEGNVLAKKELEAKNISVEFVEYSNYSDLITGLFAGECDVASLPSNYVSLFSQDDGFEDYLNLTEAIYTFDEVVKVDNESGSSIDVTSDPFTILIIGVDEGRSDSLILMSVNPNTLTLTMTSIARDTYVPIACYSEGARDKINHARAVSRQCTVDTVEEWLGYDIDFYVETNFEGVVSIVDSLGGLEITSPITFVGQDSSTERGHYTVWVPEGTHMLNGEQVLAFARERYQMPNGDYDRQVHQQEVIKAMIEAVFEVRDINILLDVLDAAGKNISTNMSINQMTSLANYLFKIADSIPIKYDYLLNIKNSRITGYSSYYYNYSAGLPLWIMLPYNGAVKDCQNLINDNLISSAEKKLTLPTKFEASVLYEYEFPEYYQEYYDEVLEHIDMPDFMPNMKFSYTVNEAEAWCNERNIKLELIGVYEGDPNYVAGYPQGTIIDQSQSYATLTENFSSLTLWVTDLNGAPNCVGQPYYELTNWCYANGYSWNINWISDGDSDYDRASAGLIVDQSTDYNAYSCSITAYDYPLITRPLPDVGSSKEDVDKWSQDTGVSVEYSGETGKVKSYTVINNYGNPTSTSVKTTSVVKVELTGNEKFEVTFKNGVTDEVIETITVKKGENATFPADPVMEGYTFKGWDSDGTNITSNITISAKFKKKKEDKKEDDSKEESKEESSTEESSAAD